MPMTDLAALLAMLMTQGQVLTIHKTEDGLLVGFAEVVQIDDRLAYLPEMLVTSTADIGSALFAFNEQYQMIQVANYSA
jgi:hypothetical protein